MPFHKPTAGEHGKWVSLARNQNPRQALTLGYYVVKNPGQTQLDEGMTFEEARQREDAFLRSDPHWSKVICMQCGQGKWVPAVSCDAGAYPLTRVKQAGLQSRSSVHAKAQGTTPT